MPSRPRSKPPKAYHHGDLRDALVRSGLALVATEGQEALTLRAVARDAGVSQAAPYRHFKDRRALVGAVAEEGFRMLGQAMMVAMQGEGGARGFRGVADAYVTFGLANPGLYRIMFGPEVARQDDLPSLAKTSGAVLGFVAESIKALQGQGIIGAGDPWAIANATWSMLHGLVMLTLDGQTEGTGLPHDVLVQEATRIMMLGMAKR